MTPGPNVLFIESRSHFDAARQPFATALACALADPGDGRARVAVLLVQNGALCARSGAQAPQLDALAAAGVSVYADEFSLRERGIAVGRLRKGVEPVPLDIVIDRLLEGWRVIWH
jgi:intracellular sulfur oxidation DsrE/DsrF family protein